MTIFKRSIYTVTCVAVLGALLLYVTIHYNLAGLAIEKSLTQALAEKLETRVTLAGDVEVDWLNQVTLHHLTIYDQQEDTLLYARRVLVAYDLLPLLRHHLVLNACQLTGFDLRAHKDSVQGAYNFQFVLDALQKKEPDSQSFIEKFDLDLIELREGGLSWDQHTIDQFNADLCIHNQLLQASQMGLRTEFANIKLSQLDMMLNLKEAIEQGRQRVFSLQGLSIDGEKLNCLADIEGNGRTVSLQLHQFKAKGSLPGLPGIHDLEAQAEVSIDDFLLPTDSLLVKANILKASAMVNRLGQTQATAVVEGTPGDAKLNLSLKNEMGTATLDGTVAYGLQSKEFRFQGHCLTPGFDLSQLLPHSVGIGTVAASTQLEISKPEHQPMGIRLNGQMGRLDFRHHTYRDIRLNGEYHNHQIQGQIVLNDSLGQIDLTCDLDLSHPQSRYKIDGEVHHLQPMALNLAKHRLLDSLAFSGQLNADIIVQDKRAEGVVNLTRLHLQRGDEGLQLEPISFEGTASRGYLSSQLLHIEYQHERKDSTYLLKGHIPVCNELYSLLRLPLQATSTTRFEFTINERGMLRKAWLDLPTVITDRGQQIRALAEVSSGDSSLLYPSIDLDISSPKHRLTGTLTGELSLQPLNVSLSPSTFIYNDEELRFTGAHLAQNEEGGYAFRDFGIEGKGQSLSASGMVGGKQGNDLAVQLERFELGQVFSLFNKNYANFKGQATGKLTLSQDPEMHLSAQKLLIENFTYIDTLLGDARLNIDYHFPRKRMDVTCDIVTDQQYTTHIGGDIRFGKRDSLDLQFDTDHLPLGFINNWTGSILQQFTGRVTGTVRLYGYTKALQLSGDPVVDGKFTHSTIGAHFHLNDTVHLEENLLTLSNVTVDDLHGHTLQLDARVTHDHLHQFAYDVWLDIPTANQGFLVLDREQAPGRIYWGQLYISGQASLKGGNGHHRFNLDVATTDKSWFYLSPFERDFAADGNDVYSFLTFRDKATLQPGHEASSPMLTQQEDKTDKSSRTDIQIDMQVNATDQCQVFVQLDPLADDKLICRGSGDLAIHYDPRRDITLAGTYHISSGTYGMSMKGDLMSKTFQLQNTSSVRFSGVPSEAELNLNARYGIPSVNLTDLDESITALGSLSRSTVPVDCLLSVTGQLSAPQVSFDLDVKNVSEEIQAYVHNIIGTPEMLNQEVLYLLLFSKFYTPQYVQSTQSHSGSELSSFASASINSQLNQLLGHLSDSFTMGTNFRTDRGDFTDMEMDLSLSTRLLGDRLLLNGNLGYRDPTHRLGKAGVTNSFIGDFDLEFLINSRGTIRAKAYSHYNERDYSINNAQTTQGIGFILRKDFNSFLDIFKRKK